MGAWSSNLEGMSLCTGEPQTGWTKFWRAAPKTWSQEWGDIPGLSSGFLDLAHLELTTDISLNSNIHEHVGNEREKNILSLQGPPSAKTKPLRHGSWSLSSTILCACLQQLHSLSFGVDSATMAGSPNSSYILKCWSHVPKIWFFLLTIKTYSLLGTFISVKHGKS